METLTKSSGESHKANRYIPRGYTEYKPEQGEYVKTNLYACYTQSEGGKFFAIFYKGRGNNPVFHNRFRTEEEMRKKINSTIASLIEWEKHKEELKAKRAQPHTLKVGDILYSSWGYDQTNIDFYQVTKLIGARMVEIRELSQTSTQEIGFMTAECMPVKDSFKGEARRVMASADNIIKVRSFAYAFPWDGKAKRYSWYA